MTTLLVLEPAYTTYIRTTEKNQGNGISK